jgi:hypothetical protein
VEAQIPLVTDPMELAIQRLQAVCGLGREAAARAVSEVADAFAYEVDDFVSARHAELRARGLDNTGIFRLIKLELRQLRFKAPPLSDRQLRRRIYG